MDWSADQIKTLITMWEDGKSEKQIAETMRLSRNAVAGKLNRLRAAGVQFSRRCCTQPKLKRKRVRKPRVRNPAEPRPPPPPRPARFVPYDAPRPCSLFDLDATRCHWPYGHPDEEGFYFCGGEAADGRPYCPRHCAEAYETLEDRERRRNVHSPVPDNAAVSRAA